MQGSTKCSSTEAEYIQLSHVGKDVQFIVKLFTQFLSLYDDRLVIPGKPVSIQEDNKGAIDTAEGCTTAKKLRHMDHCDHHCRDLVEEGMIVPDKVPTKENVADLTTKPPDSRPVMVRLWGKVGLEIL